MTTATAETYKSAGVDIDAGNRFVGMIKERVGAAWPEAREIGGFAGSGVIPAGATRFGSSTDGTGTKIILAALANRLYRIAQDGMAMGVVDTYLDGYYPYGVLDSLDVAVLDPDLHIYVIEGLIECCLSINCILIGGETAELPDMFKHDWMMNLNVFTVGFPIPGLEYVPVRPGQNIYGWLSDGPCANGFSLLRKIFRLKDKPSLVRKRLNKNWPELNGATLADVLLEPTPIHINSIENLRKNGTVFAGHAHITGGGMIDNVPRIMPSNCKAVIDKGSWVRPRIFSLAQELGKVPEKDMERTFNNGIIVVSIVEGEMKHVDAVKIGTVEARSGDEPQIQLVGSYTEES